MSTRRRDGTLVSDRPGVRHNERASPPLIDIAAPRPDVVEAIDAACTEIGFFVVTGHGIEAQVDEVFRAARELFALPEATKEALAMVDRQGFVPARHAVLDDSLHSAPAEYYDVGTRGEGRWPSSDRPPVISGSRHAIPAGGTRGRRRPAGGAGGGARSRADLLRRSDARSAVLPADVPLRDTAPPARRCVAACSPTRTPTMA